VDDLLDAVREQHVEQRAQIADGERIDERGALVCGNLDGADLGVIAPLTDELGVEVYDGRLAQIGAKRGQLSRLFDDYGALPSALRRQGSGLRA